MLIQTVIATSTHRRLPGSKYGFFYRYTFTFMNVYFFSMNIPLFSWTLLFLFILYPNQAIDRLSKGELSSNVDSMRTKSIKKVVGDGTQEKVKIIQEELMDIKHQVAVNKH